MSHSFLSLFFWEKVLNSKTVRTLSPNTRLPEEHLKRVQQAKELLDHFLKTQLSHYMCRSQGPHPHWSLWKVLHSHLQLPTSSQPRQMLLPLPLLTGSPPSSSAKLPQLRLLYWPHPHHIVYRLELVMHLTCPQDYKLLKSKDYIWLIPVCSPQGLAKQQVLKYGMNDHCVFLLKNNLGRDFPGYLVVKNPPCNARDTGSILGQGSKILHSSGQRSPRTAQLSLHAITTESVHHKDPHATTKTWDSQINIF